MLHSSPRMTTEERRRSILQSVRKVFAEKGFHGTTTRALAVAAGVSEALLFKHFPTKDAIYLEMQQQTWEDISRREIERILALPSSTDALIILIHALISKILHCSLIQSDAGPTYMEQLMLRSLLEDGDFARGMLKRFELSWLAKFADCLAAARREGSLVESPVPDSLRGWLVHDMVVMTMLQLMPTPPAADHGFTREQLIGPSLWFALRGIGMRDELVERYVAPEALGRLRPPDEFSVEDRAV